MNQQTYSIDEKILRHPALVKKTHFLSKSYDLIDTEFDCNNVTHRRSDQSEHRPASIYQKNKKHFQDKEKGSGYLEHHSKPFSRLEAAGVSSKINYSKHSLTQNGPSDVYDRSSDQLNCTRIKKLNLKKSSVISTHGKCHAKKYTTVKGI